MSEEKREEQRRRFLGSISECLAAVGLLVVIGLISGLVLIPKSLDARVADESVAAQRLILVPSQTVEIQHGRYVKGHLAQERGELALLERQIPTTADYRSIITSVLTAAQHAGVVVMAETSSPLASGTGGISEVPLSITVSGTAKGMVGFVSDLEQQRRIISVTGVQFKFALSTATVVADAYTGAHSTTTTGSSQS